jgi:hypothetical protein
MPCMGPSTDHVEAEAEALTQAIMQVLERRGIERPSNMPTSNLERAWDEEVAKLKDCITQLMKLDAYDKF